MKEVYAKELSDRTATARRALAQKLLDQAAKTDDNPADQFVLIVGAIEAAREGGNLGTGFRAAELMAERYAADELAVKVDTALKAAAAPDTAAAAENVRAGVALLDSLEAAGDYTDAVRVGAVLPKFAATDPSLRAAAQKRSREADELRRLVTALPRSWKS